MVGKFESSYCNIYLKELKPSKENTDKHQTRFLDLDIKIKDGKFRLGLFDKRYLFFFLLSEFQTCQVMYHLLQFLEFIQLVYPTIGADSLRIAGVSNSPESFSTATKPLITRMSRQGISIRKIQSYSKLFLATVTQILEMFVKVGQNC